MSESSTVLIVDDTPLSLDVLTALLQREGYRTVSARNGFEALALAEQLRPDAIVLDVMMPEMDGYEVCRRIRSHPKLDVVPVIMLTALDDRPSRLRGLEAGADDFLTKPLDATELKARLRTITRLNRYRRVSENAIRFESALANAPDAVVIANDSGTILLSNRAFSRLIKSDESPTSILSLIPPEEHGQWRKWLRLTEREPDQRAAYETTLITAEFPQAPTVEILCSRIPWHGDQVFLLNLRDVSERKRLQQVMVQTQRLEILSQVSGAIVHDLNNVLAAINGNAQLLELGDPNRAHAYVENIVTSCGHGASVLRQLLQFTRADDHEKSLTRLETVIDQVVKLVRTALGFTCPLNYQVESAPPPIFADPAQVHLVLLNLCMNAKDAMPDGGPVRVTVRAVAGIDLPDSAPPTLERTKIHAMMSVQDEGPGIPFAIRDRLFEPFFTTKADRGGSGLGLPTVMRMMHAHGGFITIASQPGEGARFDCYFPAADSSLPPR